MDSEVIPVHDVDLEDGEVCNALKTALKTS